jgi:hypothetical protein
MDGTIVTPTLAMQQTSSNTNNTMEITLAI